MVSVAYARAYTEVLEILRHFSNEEYSKIPESKIEYFKQNMDTNYNFSIDPSVDLKEQNISMEANAIIVSLFRDYFATDKQRVILKNLLKQNQDKRDAELREKYNPDNLFKNKQPKVIENTSNEPEHNEMIEYKESIFTSIKNWFKRTF